MQKNIARLAILVLLCSCSKKDQTPSSGAGIDVDGGTSGPSGTWLTTITTPLPNDTTIETIHLNSDQTVARINVAESTLGGVLNADTIYYSSILPVYSGGRLTAVQFALDTVSATGTVVRTFDYTPGGLLQRIQYDPGTPAYAYDSVVTGAGGLMAMCYHFATTSGVLAEQSYESFSWGAGNNLQSILVSTIDPTNGSVSDLTVTYTYDGFYNPYKTVRDLPFLLGSIADELTALSAGNPLSATLVGYNAANNYAYQYNPNNLPASQNVEVLQQGSIKQSTFVYFAYNH